MSYHTLMSSSTLPVKIRDDADDFVIHFNVHMESSWAEGRRESMRKTMYTWECTRRSDVTWRMRKGHLQECRKDEWGKSWIRYNQSPDWDREQYRSSILT